MSFRVMQSLLDNAWRATSSCARRVVLARSRPTEAGPASAGLTVGTGRAGRPRHAPPRGGASAERDDRRSGCVRFEILCCLHRAAFKGWWAST